MAYNKEEKEKYDFKSEELKAAIQEIGETFKTKPELIADAVAFGADFYHYSYRNMLLIYRQNPHCQYVQSFQAWKQMDASVKRGEHGMSILTPVEITYLKTGPEDYTQLRYASEEQKRAYRNNEIESIKTMRYRVGTVFDISQTTFPKERYPELFHMGYDSRQCKPIIEGLRDYCKTEISCPVELKSLRSITLRGQYDPALHQIELNHLLEDTERLSTLTHEMGHALLHSKSEGRAKPAAQIEFEADALSIMLQKHYGIEITDARKRHLAGMYKILEEKEQDIDLGNCLNHVYSVYKESVALMDRYVEKKIEKEKEWDEDKLLRDMGESPIELCMRETVSKRPINQKELEREA